MTMCLAWKDEEGVTLACDGQVSSYGDVYLEAQKYRGYGTWGAVAFSGAWEDCLKAYSGLKHKARPKVVDVDWIFKNLYIPASTQAGSTNGNWEFLFVHADGIFSFGPDTGVIEHAAFAAIGNGSMFAQGFGAAIYYKFTPVWVKRLFEDASHKLLGVGELKDVIRLTK